MRVLLKEVLDCDPNAAWRAIRSPAVFAEVASPLLVMQPAGPDGFPTVWDEGDHAVRVTGAGLLPLGTQLITLNVQTRQHGDVRILRDTGKGLSGPLAAVSHWDHRMAISDDPAGTGKTLYRDQLIFGAGPATVALWPSFWAFWQWRMAKLKRMAPSWRFDLGVDDPNWTRAEPTDADADLGAWPWEPS